MKRFGTIYPFVERGAGELAMGRLVANHDVARALVTHADFDEFVFSNPSAANLARFGDVASGWGLPAERCRRLRLVPYSGMADLLAHEVLHVMHLGGWGHFMPGLHAIRSRLSRRLFPITAVIHSLDGREVLDHAVRLTHAGMAACDAIFCTSRDGRRAFEHVLAAASRISGRCFAGELLDVPLGVEDRLIDQPGDGRRARARLRVPDDAVVLLSLGRMTPSRKADLTPLVRAFARLVLPAARVPMVLVIAGGGSALDVQLMRETVERHGVSPHVRLHANFHPADKADLLAMADVLVAPSDNTQETFGLSLLEAQAAAVPVVAARFDGFKDLLRHGEDGFLVETLWAAEADPLHEWAGVMDPNVAQLLQAQSVAVDMETLARRILDLAHDGPLRRAMGRAGQEKVSRSYRWRDVVRSMEKEWDRLARMAAALPPSSADDPWQVSPAEIFLHYASHVLCDDDVVVAAVGSVDEPMFAEVASVVPAALMNALVEQARRPVRVRELIDAAAAPARTVRFAVLWLLKHQMLCWPRRTNDIAPVPSGAAPDAAPLTA